MQETTHDARQSMRVGKRRTWLDGNVIFLEDHGNHDLGLEIGHVHAEAQARTYDVIHTESHNGGVSIRQTGKWDTHRH